MSLSNFIRRILGANSFPVRPTVLSKVEPQAYQVTSSSKGSQVSDVPAPAPTPPTP